MDQPPSTSLNAEPTLDIDDLPPGNHALEVAARRGFGPLSPVARRVWHGESVPCVTCGQLVPRGADQCDHCSQDLREEMVQKMRAHAGPWFVLEHLRPFPGVSLDRIVRQIRRGLITETSIVRGPATDFQWRFAVETPGLCRYFGRCWHCHHEVGPGDAYCPSCLSHLAFENPRPAEQGAPRSEVVPAPNRPPVTASLAGAVVMTTAAAPRPAASEVRPPLVPQFAPAVSAARTMPSVAQPVARPSSELEKLATAVRKLEAIPPAPDWDAPARIGPFRASWLAATVLVLGVVVLLAVVQYRSAVPKATPPENSGQVAPATPPPAATPLPAP